MLQDAQVQDNNTKSYGIIITLDFCRVIVYIIGNGGTMIVELMIRAFSSIKRGHRISKNMKKRLEINERKVMRK